MRRPVITPEQRSFARSAYYSRNSAFQSPRVSDYRSRFQGRSYGMFAGGFLASLLLMNVLDHNTVEASTWYGLSSEPEFDAFIDDARREAEIAGDTDVLARLDALEQELAAMPQSGLPQMTPQEALRALDAPEAVALADSVPVTLGTVSLTMTTGGPHGVYHSICTGSSAVNFEGLKTVGERFNLDVTCQNSGGGNDNLRLAALNESQVFPVQADNLYYYKTRSGQSFGDNEYVLYQEPFLMLAAKDSALQGLSDIGAETTVYVVGGAELSWNILRDFAANDTFLGFGGNTDYARATVKRVDDINTALSSVAQDPNAVLFIVMAVQGKAIQEIDQKFGNDLQLVPIDDSRFLSLEDPNGGRVYTECEIPGNALPKLQEGALWGTNDTATLCTDALLVVSQNWVKSLSEEQARQVAMAILEVLESVNLLAPRMDM